MARRPSMTRAVQQALRAVTLRPEDAAAQALALRYARDIDEAQLVAAQLTKVLREVAALDVDVHDRLLPLATRIEDTTVLASLGPKLLAALAELGMTPKARAAVIGKGAPGDGPGRSALDAARERRARQRHAAAVDPTAS